MPSIQAKLVSGLFKLIGVNKMLDKQGEDFEIFYGTREVMIAYLKDFQAACKKYGVKLNTHIGKGMMHCWGAMEFVPEAKAVRREYFEALR